MIRALPTLLVAALAMTNACVRKGDKDKGQDAKGPERQVAFTVDQGASLLPAPAVGEIKVRLTCDGFADDHADQQIVTLGNGGVLTLFGSQTNCLVKLLEFSVGTTLFKPAAGKDFTTYKPGDQATFEAGTDQRTIRVDAQLPSPITANASVRYAMSAIEGEEVMIEPFTGPVTNHDVLITGAPPPALEVLTAKLVTVNPITAAVRVEVACREAAACADGALAAVNAIFVKKEAGDVTLATLQALFTAAPAVPVPQLPAFAALPASTELTHGGFRIQATLASLGVAKTSDLPQMPLLLAFGNAAGSFRYAILVR